MHLHHVLFLGGLSIAASVAHAQSPVFGRLYDAQDRVLLTLPAPLPSGHFASKGVRDAVGSVAPSYIRLYASTLANATDKALDTPPVKPHEEVRSDNLIKIVVWTHERLLEPTAEILTRAMQRYLASAVQLQASQGRAQPANGMQLNLDQLALDKATVMEIELMGVEESQLIRHPFCRRTTGGNEDPTFVGRDAPLPCPSLVLADQMYLAKWAQNEMLRPLDAIFGRLAFNPLTDIADPGKYNLRFNAAWVCRSGSPGVLPHGGFCLRRLMVILMCKCICPFPIRSTALLCSWTRAYWPTTALHSLR